ncbi:hypothetical protein [Agromyces sp. GXS1127]|uniref:hypothetical protein n=1 Tax=Agromyces sp. GXS1127 TaxID=3424181 RepID=UPI003D311B1C
MSIAIGPPTIEVEGDRLEYRVDLSGFPGVDRLWFSLPASAAPFVNERTDAAVLALAVPAMRLGRDLVVQGAVTDEIVWNLSRDLGVMLEVLRPEIGPISIRADDRRPAAAGGSAVATGYSAGVDSFATLARHHFAADVPEALRLTHLLYNNVGSHGTGENGRELYRKRLALLRPSALATGLPLIDVDSNVDELFSSVRLEFQPTHTIRNAAVAHLLGGGLRRYLYASTAPYSDIAVAPTGDMSMADPILLPYLSTSALTLQPDGTDLTRAEKMEVIATVPETWDTLDVCVASRDGSNCSECWKCQRTMLTLELLGVFDRYSGRFVEPRDPEWRDEYVIRAMREPGPSARDFLRLYDQRIGIPLRLRLAAGRRRAAGAAAYAGRRIGREVRRRVGRG